MGEIIKLRSRYSTVTSELKQILPLNSDNEKTFKLSTNSQFIRCGYLEDGTFWIDPEGGPMIQKGTEIAGRVVKSIEHSYELGYIITFE